MARMKVRLRGKTVYDIQLASSQSYIAGRREDCDIVLEAEKGISREHLRIFYDQSHWHVEVLSRFGEVLSEGEKIQNLDLEGHRIFHISSYEFEYSEMSTALVAVANGASPAVAEEGEKTFVGLSASVPHVKVMDEFGDTQELFKLDTGDNWIAGRDSACDIVIRDQRVSRRQFEIRRQGNQYRVMDLGSVNGTFLNGSPVSSTEGQPLKSGDSITVLDNQFYFELHDPHFQTRLELVKNTAPALAPANSEAGPLAAPLPSMAPYPQMPSAAMPPPSKKFDFEKHRIKIFAGAALLLGIAYYVSDSMNNAPAPASVADGAGRPQDVFNRLKPEQQTLVRQTYQLADNLFKQGKYELAKAEILKVYELVPDYENIKELERLCNEALLIQQEQKRQEDLEKAKAEAEAKIQSQVTECKGKLNPDFTQAQLEECLAPVLQFNPDHPAINELRAQVDQLVATKQAKEAQRAEYQTEVKKLKGLFEKAEAARTGNQYLKAIKDYQVVVNSSLPDPHDLKGEARKQLAAVQQTLKQKIDQQTQEADKAYTEQRLKDAILALRKAAELDPTNNDLKDKTDRYVLELRKQMMILYQEGVLEESYGNVEGNENHPGAKEKWKKIMNLDIPDGEYYGKAKIKLKKYGAL